MDVSLRRGSLTQRAAGAVAIGVFERTRKLSGAAAAVDRATRGAVTGLLATHDFSGRFLESALLYPRGLRARRLLVLGLGRREELGEQRVRQVAALAARRARELRAGTLATVVHGAGRGGLDPQRAAQAVAEGCVLGHYRFSSYQQEPGPPPLKRIDLIEHEAATARLMRPAVKRGAAWAAGACTARALANTPGQDLTPAELATRAKEIGRASGAKVRVLGVRDLEKLGMGALLAVGRGSVHPPCFIVLERGLASRPSTSATKRRTSARASDPRAPLVVIGKGVTFDTGGISLKPRENMHKMKYDMSGAAAVLGLFAALPSLELPFPVIGLIPAAENMPGGAAYKPGDVVRALDGTTIEVLNTDAEGRLLLAEALAYAQRLEPAAVVDLATLTGAITIALGSRAAGLFTQDDALGDELIASGEACGERLWRLPLWDEYASDLRSDTADLANVGGREGGSILAAIFLRRFAGSMRWAHLDIAGVAWESADRPLSARGPSGFGVRLLLEWIRRRAGMAT